ncbi:MAG TPA: DUF1592 domain-containing protein [Alphaproteobacteria bacterium]|nr:DUF1592 domain-containing protein [Alphaproteobacteria bacterium]
MVQNTDGKAAARRWLKTLAAAGCALLGFLVHHSTYAAESASSQKRLVEMRRITQDQYRQIIADVFGRTIKLGGRFEPDQRDSGLIAVGAGEASVTASGYEQYDGMARSIAGQVLDEQRRATMLACRPADPKAADDACAKQFIARIGRILYRRPLTDTELVAEIGIASGATAKVHDFYAGLALSLAGMLEAPQFLFRQEWAEADPEHPGSYRLDAYSKASRLSFLLWNAAPDPLLLEAAEKGELNDTAGLKRQVDRMLASPRVEAGVRAFFADMLSFSSFETLAKDSVLYPKFVSRAPADAQEQTLRTIIDLLVTRHGDYRDIFTTRRTFLTPLLAAIYKIPIETPNDLPDVWVPYEYPENAEQAGIVTEASFVALHSHPGRSSPTIRGKALREILLCQKVPDPPGNVNFAVVQDTSNPEFKTARARLTAHRTNPTCAGCHKIMDPVGLSLENFDTTGGFRLTENGVAIDASGELDGTKFSDPIGLGRALHDSAAATACVVNRLVSYGLGHAPTKADSDWVRNDVAKQFATDGYRFIDLLRDIATSDQFYRVTPPEMRADAGADRHDRSAKPE